MKRFVKIGSVALLLVSLLVALAGCVATETGAAEGESAGGWGSTWPMLIFLVVIFAFFWFVMVRPQRKRQKEHQEMMQSLQKGDRVITAGGIYGTIDNLSEDSIVIKVEGGTTMRVARGSVAVIREQ
jgi:preprotein translocase subunit YajC